MQYFDGNDHLEGTLDSVDCRTGLLGPYQYYIEFTPPAGAGCLEGSNYKICDGEHWMVGVCSTNKVSITYHVTDGVNSGWCGTISDLQEKLQTTCPDCE
ncbi:MAG TPA: hypothetical protein VFO76_09605 [Candidatus Kapabacteria bacterium]|nr:hypothetical protein [Candidatus Kapabacteria bacterium]